MICICYIYVYIVFLSILLLIMDTRPIISIVFQNPFHLLTRHLYKNVNRNTIKGGGKVGGEGEEGEKGKEGLTTGSVTDKMIIYFRDWY